MSGELDKSMKWDRRRQPRKIPQSFTFLQLEHDEGGRVVNLSEEGLCFESFSPIRTANPVPLWFSFNLRDRIEVTGQVVWTDSRKEVGGLVFINLSPAARQLIRAHIEHAPAEQLHEAAVAGAAMGSNAASTGGAVRTSSSNEEVAHAAPVAFPRSAGLAVVPQVAQASQAPRFGELRFPEGRAAETPESPVSILGLSEVADSPDQAPLVPLERFVAASRSQFLRGLLLGIVVTALVAILALIVALRSQPKAKEREVPAPTSSANPGTDSGSPSAKSELAPSSSAMSPAAPPTPRKNSPEVPRYDTFHSDPPPASALSSTSSRSKLSPLTPEQLWAEVQSGNPKAAVVLADLYLRGDGVPANCAQARILLQFAAQKNNPEAIKKSRALESSGCPTP